MQHITPSQGYKKGIEKPSMEIGREESIWVHKPQEAETRDSN